MVRCSICQTIVQDSDEIHLCPECEGKYHLTCWEEIGGCATYGCSQAPEAEKALPVVQYTQGWGDEKTCPACHVSIPSSVLHCSCGARFPYADQMTPESYEAYIDRESERKSARNTLLVLFFVSLLGITAPFAGLAAGLYARKKKPVLIGRAGSYRALGYGTAVIGGAYSLVYLLLFLGL